LKKLKKHIPGQMSLLDDQQFVHGQEQQGVEEPEGAAAENLENPAVEGDVPMSERGSISPTIGVRGVSRGMVMLSRAGDMSVDDGADVLDMVEGAVSQTIARAVLAKALALAGFRPTDPVYRFAKGHLIAWLVINTASGNHNFEKVLEVRSRKLPTRALLLAMREYGVDELRRLGVGLLSEQKQVVDESPKVREYLAQINGIREVGKAWLAIDSIWKLPGISPRDAGMAKQFARRKISRAREEGKVSSSSHAGDLLAVDVDVM
jgi:hypothetical protein